jgi:hypothetical protein
MGLFSWSTEELWLFNRVHIDAFWSIASCYKAVQWPMQSTLQRGTSSARTIKILAL